MNVTLHPYLNAIITMLNKQCMLFSAPQTLNALQVWV